MDKKVEIYTSPTCHFCKDLKAFLDEKNIAYTEYDVSADEEKMKELRERSQQMGVPIVFIDEKEMIVGFDKEKITAALGISKKQPTKESPGETASPRSLTG